MSKVVDLLKKTPLKPIWWKLKGVPPLYQIRHAIIDVHVDKLYYEWLPEIYETHAQKPIRENKVILIENHPKQLSNSFQCLYSDLMEDGSFDVHIHHIGRGLIHREDWEKNCAKLVADAATARYLFMSEAIPSISCLTLREGTTVVQLWHGCGAFKKFGRSTMETKFGQDKKHADRHPLYRNYDLVTVSSPEVVWAYEEAMGLENQKDVILPLGVSRTDVYFRKEFLEQAKERVYEALPQSRGKKLLLFAPTFRGMVAIAKTPDYKTFNLDALRRSLGEEWMVLIKNHPNVNELHTPVIPEQHRDTFAADVTHRLSIEDLMIASDVCITDYSSLIFEYALLDKPLLFYAYDLEKYFDWRGFYYNYEEMTPGPVCRSMKELTDALEHLEESFDPEQMKAFREKFMRSCDGHSTERIEEFVFGRSLKKQ